MGIDICQFPSRGHAQFTNDFTFHFPGLGVELDAHDTTLSIETVLGAGNGFKTVIGHGTFPKMGLKHGDNDLELITDVKLADADSLRTKFIDPMFSEGKTVKLYIDATRITGHVLKFLPVPGLHLSKVLRCNAANKTMAQKEIPANSCHSTKATDLTAPQMDEPPPMDELGELFQQLPGRRLQTVGDKQQYQVQCVADKDRLDDDSVVV